VEIPILTWEGLWSSAKKASRKYGYIRVVACSIYTQKVKVQHIYIL
jgi:hypothetical protein